MPVTFQKIASATVGSSGSASISFASIPQTYTDLMLVTSLRSLASGPGASLFFNINSMGGTNYFLRGLQGSGTAVTTGTATYAVAGQFNGNGSTANTFSNNSYYFPNYTNSANKSFSTDSVVEQNATAGWQDLVASLVTTSSPITSIGISDGSSGLNFMQYSTATLYGIKNS